MDGFRRRVSDEGWDIDGFGGVWETKCVLSFLVVLVVMLHFGFSSAAGDTLPRLYVSPLMSDWPLSMNKILLEHVRSVSARMFTSPRPRNHHEVMPHPNQPTITPDTSRTYTAPVATCRRHHLPMHKRHHCPPSGSHDMIPSPLTGKCCNMACPDPLIRSPFVLPCGCVLPMKVRLLLGAALYVVFSVTGKLETEVAAGTCLKQNQVQITGASIDKQNEEKTVVDINLIPLGNKFDNGTAKLICGRLWLKKVPLNTSIFASYQVVSISYPGIPLHCNETHESCDPPVINNCQKMDVKTIVIIFLSNLVLLLIVIGAVILKKLKSFGRLSNAVGPAFLSSTDQKRGTGSVLSGSSENATSSSLVPTMSSCIHSIRTFELPDLEKATAKFSPRRLLRTSRSGHVYHATLEDGNEVAVKLLAYGMDNLNGEREFIAQVETLSRFNHLNLVKLIGVCIDSDAQCLVYEAVPNGSVESHLHGADKKEASLGWNVRMKIALGAARVLAYLHEDSNPQVIHGDFKACNVLLEDDFTPKVSDFELARDAIKRSHGISTQVMGKSGYSEAEYARTWHLLVKADVYSYGVMLLELLSGRKPVDVSRSPGEVNLVTWARPLLTSKEGLKHMVDPSLAGSYNFYDMAKVAAVASVCIHPVVNRRPFMGEVVQALKLIYDKTDEIFDNCSSERGSSGQFSDSQRDLALSDGSWWNAGDFNAPHILTMEYSSDQLEETRAFSTSRIPDRISSPISIANRSGHLRVPRSRAAFFKSRRSMSEYWGPFTRRFLSTNNWV